MSTTEMYGPYGNRIQSEIDAKHEALQKYRNQVIAQRNAIKASVGNAPNNTFKKVFNKRRWFPSLVSQPRKPESAPLYKVDDYVVPIIPGKHMGEKGKVVAVNKYISKKNGVTKYQYGVLFPNNSDFILGDRYKESELKKSGRTYQWRYY